MKRTVTGGPTHMIGKTVSHYRLLEPIGNGGMGMVYKAKDLKLDRIVALKFLPPHAGDDPQEKSRLSHEAQAASLLDHPNICGIHEIDETPDGLVFMVMAYYDGIPLAERTSIAPVKPREALDVAIQIADGLQSAHEKGVIHCDIKSSNILVPKSGPLSSGYVKIIDFGLSERVEVQGRVKTNSTGGTVPYMSPEQVRGDSVDRRTDIWSFGVVLYEMLTGRLPFAGDYKEIIMYQILHESPPEIPAVPSDIKRVILNCLEKVRQCRYQQMADVRADLNRARNHYFGTVDVGWGWEAHRAGVFSKV